MYTDKGLQHDWVSLPLPDGYISRGTGIDGFNGYVTSLFGYLRGGIFPHVYVTIYL